MNPEEIPVEQVFRKTWLTGSQDVRIETIRVIAYVHILRNRPRSSPQRLHGCLALASFDRGAGLEFLLAPIYKGNRKGAWSGPDIECGERFSECDDRFAPLPEHFQFYKSAPNSNELLEFIKRVNFFGISENEEFIECIGPDLAGLDLPIIIQPA